MQPNKDLQNDAWPFSLREIEAAKKILYQKISFEEIVSKSSSYVEQCWHSDFTHRCTCPFHGEGKERTPSFYFSEKTKNFHCFSCAAHGCVFDFLSVVIGRPAQYIVADFLVGQEIPIDDIEGQDADPDKTNHDFIYRANLDLSILLRDYLSSWKYHSNYDEEKSWVDLFFTRIDERLGNTEMSSDDVNSFKIQVSMEISRRTAMMKRRHKDWKPTQ